MALAAAVSPPSCSTNRANRAAMAPGDAVPHINSTYQRFRDWQICFNASLDEFTAKTSPDRLDPRHRQLADGPVERDLSRAAARLPDHHPGLAGGGNGRA